MRPVQWWPSLLWTLRKWPRGSDRRGLLENVHHWVNERFTLVGKALAGLWMVALVLTMFPGYNLGEIFLLILSALFVVAWLSTWRPLRVKIECRHPTTIVEGQILSVGIRAENLSSRVRTGVHCEFFRLPDAWSPEVQERPLVALAPVAQMSLELTARQRGLWKLPLPTILSTEPLGLARTPCRTVGELVITVLPHPMRILSLPDMARTHRFGQHTGAQEARPDGDVVGVRPWRDGDRLRDVSHRAWARYGKPHVRERESAGTGVRSVVLETGCLRWRERQRIEPMIRIAAGILQFLEEREQLDQLWIDQTKIVLPRSGRTSAMLEALAAIPVPAWGRWRKPQSLRKSGVGTSSAMVLSVCDAWLQRELRSQALPESWECFLLAEEDSTMEAHPRVHVLKPVAWTAAELSL